MSSSFEILDWDSYFFGIKVARLNNSTSPDDLGRIIENLITNQVNVVYCFAPPDDHARNEALLQSSAKLVDQKVTYCIDIRKWNYVASSNVHPYGEKEADSTLVKIAQQTSDFSRFRVDQNFGEGACNRLYKQWIKNAVEGLFDDQVLIFKQEDEILGLVTLKEAPGTGRIGLLGVDEKARGQQVGKALLNKAISVFQEKGFGRLEVSTQKANRAACKFYEKNGLKLCEQINVYHLWL